MKIKTSELIGPALDRAVAKARGFSFNGKIWEDGKGHYILHSDSPSTTWSLGGPIIEQEEITVAYDQYKRGEEEAIGWCAGINTDFSDEFGIFGCGGDGYGPTPLIAAMRCFVASKLGDEFDAPEGLL